jgi:RecB family exonuclease
MSQLSFDGFNPTTDNKPLSPEPAAPSWYKGRTLSHSSISLYQTCPQKWKFRYIDKVPEKPKSFFSFGKSVHASLEFLFEKVKAKPELEDVLSHYKTNWLSEGYETPAQEKWFYQEGERILRGFYAKHHTDFDRILEIEFKFTVDVGGVPMTGFIDRIDKGPKGGIALLDYKTGKAFDKSRVRTDAQLTLYQMAARQLLGKEVESVTLYHLNSLTPLTVPAHSREMETKLISTIVEVGKGISEERFPTRLDERGHCQWCDYQQICSAFSSKKGTTAIPSLGSTALAEKVDRFAKLDAKIKEYAMEREQLKIELGQAMRDRGEQTLKGKQFSVTQNQETKEIEFRDLSGELP